MKKFLTYILAIVLLLSTCMVTSGCQEKADKEFLYYYFNERTGRLESNINKTIYIDDENSTVKVSSSSKVELLNYIKDGIKLKVDGETVFYTSDYFIAPTQYLVGYIRQNEDGTFNGNTVFDNGQYQLLDDVIYNNDLTVGRYEVNNSYITLALNGEERVYLLLKIAEQGGVKTYGVFSTFYTTLKVLAPTIENTGFNVSPEVMVLNQSGIIEVDPFVRSYTPKLVDFKIIEDGGYNFLKNSSGNYSLQLKDNQQRSDIVLNVTMDGLSKDVIIYPAHILFEKTKFENITVGQELDLTSADLYDYYGMELDRVNFSFTIADIENIAVRNDNILTFEKEGTVTISYRANFQKLGLSYEVSDKITVNVKEGEVTKAK